MNKAHIIKIIITNDNIKNLENIVYNKTKGLENIFLILEVHKSIYTIKSLLSYPQKLSNISYIKIIGHEKLVNMDYCLTGISFLQKVYISNCSNVSSATSAFMNCSSLQSIKIQNSFQNLVNFDRGFYGCLSLKKIDMRPFSNISSFNEGFYSCISLDTIELLNQKNLQFCESTFSYCESLKSALVNCPLLSNINYMFSNCESLLSINLSKSKKIQKAISTFQSCRKLQYVILDHKIEKDIDFLYNTTAKLLLLRFLAN